MTPKTRDSGFFTESLATRDPEISAAIRGELGQVVSKFAKSDFQGL